jgi:hypothetical protein
VTRKDIAHWRLAGQRLLDPAFRGPHEAVTVLGAVQAQDYPAAKWALGLRARSLSDSDVDQALNEGTIIRTHVLRPTWHLVAREDVRWMLELTAPRIHAATATLYRFLGMDAALVRKSNAALERALAGRHRTRAELLGILERKGVTVTQPMRSSYLLMRAELDQVICSGPRVGSQLTYALFDERVPQAKPLPRDEALHRLALCYFRTRGPATLHDFAWWSGLAMPDAKRAIETAADELEHTVFDERSHWFVATAAPPLKQRGARAHLLPNYDEYFIGFKDRSAMCEALRAAGSDTRNNVLGAHLLCINGQAIGAWKRAIGKKEVIVQVQLWKRPVPAELRAIGLSAKRYAEFIGMPVRVTGI